MSAKQKDSLFIGTQQGVRWAGSFVAVAICILPILVVGCRHVPPGIAAPPVATLGGPPGVVDRLEAGRAVYLSESKCARCHHPQPVSDYTAEQWTSKILPRMANKAKLTAQEHDEVQAYVLAAAKPAR